MVDARFYSDKGPSCLADLIDGLSIGLPDSKFEDEMISAPAVLAGSLPGQVAFLASKKHIKELDTAKATACLVPEDLASAVGQKHILPLITKYPRAHFSRIIDRLVTPKSIAASDEGPNIHPDAIVHKDTTVHTTAIIGPGAIIERGCHIAPYAVIGAGVHIGANSEIGSHAVIKFADIGTHCHIKPSAVIGGRGFGVDGDELGLVSIAHIGRVIIGDRVAIGSATCVDRAQFGDTYIGDDVKIDNQVQVAHNVVIGAGSMIAAQTGISGSCTVGEGVIMGGNVGLADHLHIGDGVQIAAKSGVMHNIPAGEKWGGLPAMPMRDYLKSVAAIRRLVKPKSPKNT